MKNGYIKALEGLEERRDVNPISDGCDLCSADLPRDAEPAIKVNLGNIFGKEITLETYIFGNTLVNEISEGEQEGLTERTQIAFCPFCGRKL